MGHGSYQSKDWNNLRSARNINQNSTVNDIYRSRQMRPNLDPNGVKYRESCDPWTIRRPPQSFSGWM